MLRTKTRLIIFHCGTVKEIVMYTECGFLLEINDKYMDYPGIITKQNIYNFERIKL